MKMWHKFFFWLRVPEDLKWHCGRESLVARNRSVIFSRSSKTLILFLNSQEESYTLWSELAVRGACLESLLDWVSVNDFTFSHVLPKHKGPQITKTKNLYASNLCADFKILARQFSEAKVTRYGKLSYSHIRKYGRYTQPAQFVFCIPCIYHTSRAKNMAV